VATSVLGNAGFPKVCVEAGLRSAEETDSILPSESRRLATESKRRLFLGPPQKSASAPMADPKKYRRPLRAGKEIWIYPPFSARIRVGHIARPAKAVRSSTRRVIPCTSRRRLEAFARVFRSFAAAAPRMDFPPIQFFFEAVFSAFTKPLPRQGADHDAPASSRAILGFSERLRRCVGPTRAVDNP
jgi:hypothetical protein